MKVVIASRNWPPDIGGPASHAPELAEFLHSRGHAVRAVATAGPQGPCPAPFPLRTSRRDRPRVVRLPASAIDVAAAARGADVLYATGMYTRAALAAGLQRLPLVIKLVNDPAYERARRLGLFSGSVEEFQAPLGHPAITTLKRLRRTMLSRARALVVPSRFLADIAARWGLGVGRIVVVPNPAPEPPAGSRAQLRRRLGIDGPTIAFAGRLAEQKDVPLALAALERVPAVRLVVVGDGPERGRIERLIAQRGLAGRVSLRGALPRAEALEWIRASDAALLPSAWENFPHAAVEAISLGTPVVATTVGGVPEIVEDGISGLLVAPGDAEAMAAAIAALFGDDGLLERLRETTAPSAARFERRSTLGRIEDELLALAPSPTSR